MTTEAAQPVSTLQQVVAFFRMDGGDLPLSEVKSLSEQDRLDLRRDLDSFRISCGETLN